MIIRYIDKPELTGTTGSFNISGIGEVIVYYDIGDCSSEFINNLEVYLTYPQKWYNMQKAFKDKLIIPDNYNTYFREPRSDLERSKGYF